MKNVNILKEEEKVIYSKNYNVEVLSQELDLFEPIESRYLILNNKIKHLLKEKPNKIVYI